MRGMIDGMPSPNPIGLALPAVFADDDFAQDFVSGLDDLLAPIFHTLDCLDSYLDPHLAPPDFLWWLAGWVGVELDERWPEERQRALVTEIAALYGMRGTVTGLREVLRIYTGGEAEIVDTGGVAWSPVPGGELPGNPTPKVTVRVQASEQDLKRVRELVAAGTPAHVPWEIEVATA